MKRIPKLLVVILVLVLTLASCDNSLWYGGNNSEADFSLRLELPYPEQSLEKTQSTGRALALQGLHIFIEIADIQDVSSYTDPNGDESTDDSLFHQVPDGDGNWVSTPWGGHAVFHARAYGTEAITVEFNNVPTDRDLLIRVVQDIDKQTIVSEMADVFEGYGNPETGWFPMSQTFDSGGEGPWKDLGISITSDQLSSGRVRIPLRPHDYSFNIGYYPAGISSNPINFVGTGSSLEPIPGETQFFELGLDMFGNDTLYPGMLVGTKIALNDGVAVPGIISLYDTSGTLVEPDLVRSTVAGPDRTIVSYSVVKPALSGLGGTNYDYFLGSTLIPGINLDDGDYSEFSFIAQPLVSDVPSSTVYDIDDHEFGWNVPYDNLGLLKRTDLEYQVLYWLDVGGDFIGSINELDMEEVLSYDPVVLIDWGSAEGFLDPLYPGDSSVEFLLPNLLSLPPLSAVSPTYSDYCLIVVLARLPGGEPFLITGITDSYNIG